MTTHVTTTDLSLLGFEKSVFNLPASLSWDDFLQPIIDRAERAVAARVTIDQANAASGAATFDQVAGAVKAAAAQELFNTLETVTMNTQSPDNDGSRSQAPSESVKSAKRYRKECDRFLDELGADPLFADIGFSGGSSAVVETGHFEGVAK